MSDFKSVLQQIVNEDYNTIVQLASVALNRIISFMKEAGMSDDMGTSMLYSLVHLGVGADGELTDKEKQFLRDVFKLSGSLDDFLDSGSIEVSQLKTEVMFAVLDTEYKAHVSFFLFCLFAVDEKVSREEMQVFKKFI